MLLPVFTDLYFAMLKQFNEEWKKQEKHNIMVFEQVIARVYMAEFLEKRAVPVVQEWVANK